VILKCWGEGVQELQELQNGSAGYRLVEEVVKGQVKRYAFNLSQFGVPRSAAIKKEAAASTDK